MQISSGSLLYFIYLLSSMISVQYQLELWRLTVVVNLIFEMWNELSCQPNWALCWNEGVVLVLGVFFCSSVTVKELIEQAFNDSVKFNLRHCKIKYRTQTCYIFIFRLLTKFFSVKMSKVSSKFAYSWVAPRFLLKMYTCWHIHSFNLGKTYLWRKKKHKPTTLIIYS